MGDDDVALLMLRGAKPAELGVQRAPHIFDGAQLHVPEHVHPEDRSATDDALYHSQPSAFVPFKTDTANSGNFVLVIHDGVARVRAVRHLQELHRDHDRRVGKVSQYVMWDSAVPVEKRLRAEATAE